MFPVEGPPPLVRARRYGDTEVWKGVRDSTVIRPLTFRAASRRFGHGPHKDLHGRERQEALPSVRRFLGFHSGPPVHGRTRYEHVGLVTGRAFYGIPAPFDEVLASVGHADPGRRGGGLRRSGRGRGCRRRGRRSAGRPTVGAAGAQRERHSGGRQKPHHVLHWHGYYPLGVSSAVRGSRGASRHRPCPRERGIERCRLPVP